MAKKKTADTPKTAAPKKAEPKFKPDVARAVALLTANLSAAHPATNGTVLARTREAIAALGG